MIHFLLTLLVSSPAIATQNLSFERGQNAINAMAGCYLVDYNFVETESLKEGYVRDNRVYDVNKDKSVKELIYTEEVSPNHIRLQHILFATTLGGELIAGTMLKHQAEDWEFNAAHLYDFIGPSKWKIQYLERKNQWTRRITNLDDGLRYQCASTWSTDTAYPEWTCSNYAPIPGREFRDMGRKDYNTLQRTTRVISYGTNWLERQDNIKTIDKDGLRTPLAREATKTWYTRIPDSECAPARNFVNPRLTFWAVLREAWAAVLDGRDEYYFEKTPAGAPPRFVKMGAIEESFMSRNLLDPAVRSSAQQEIWKLIEEYRAH